MSANNSRAGFRRYLSLRTAGLFGAAFAALICGTSQDALAANSPGCTAVAAHAPVGVGGFASTGVVFNSGQTANFWFPGDVLTATGTNPSDFSEVVLSSGASANASGGVTTYTIQNADVSASVDFALSPDAGGSTYTFTCSPGTAPPPATAASISAAFSPTAITTAQTSTLTLTISNLNVATTLAGLAVSSSPLPANLNGSSPATTCTSGTATFAAGSLSLSGASLAPSSTCTVTLTVSSTTPNNYSYTTGTVSSTSPSTTGGTATTPTALTVTAAASAPTVTAAFSPTSITSAQTSTLTLTITNPNAGTALTAVAVSAAALPANLNGSSPATTCGGTATFAAGSLSLSGGSLANSGTCTVTLTVSSIVANNYSYTTGQPSASGTATGSVFTTPTPLTVTALSAPTITAAFSPTSISSAQTSTLTLTLTNPSASSALTGVAVSGSPLPANLNGSSPATTCGGTATLTAGSLSLSGGSLATSGTCTVTLTVSSTVAATYVYTTGLPSATGTAAGSPFTTSPGLTVLAASNTTVVSSANPSTFGQAVTFTATVTGTSPTGSVTFKDGGTTLAAGVPLSGGHASFTISTLSLGTHPITVVYSGDATNAASTSTTLSQAVGVPLDSQKLQALQVAVTKLVAQGSGSATSGAIDGAISEGFNDNGALISGSDNGMHVNFAAEPEKQSAVEDRVGDAFAALGYAKRDKSPVFKAPVYAAPPKEWLAWLDVRGTGWSTGVQTGDIRGTQVNALAGLTRRITPNFLVGVFGGYETFDYTSQLLNGRLKGDGWTIGSYLGWRLTPGLRFDAGIARSGVNYDGTAGTASGTFPGQRWLLTTGLTGTYKTAPGFVLEPSAKVYALWEHEAAYNDTLGIAHPDRDFSTGRASLGAKVAYPWMTSASVTIAPYVGLYGDYYFNQDNAVALGAPNLLPTEFVHGLSARVTSGVTVSTKDGKSISFGGEYGGLGNDYSVWSVRARGSVAF